MLVEIGASRTCSTQTLSQIMTSIGEIAWEIINEEGIFLTSTLPSPCSNYLSCLPQKYNNIDAIKLFHNFIHGN